MQAFPLTEMKAPTDGVMGLYARAQAKQALSGWGVTEYKSLLIRPSHLPHQIPAARPLPVLCWRSGQEGSHQPFPSFCTAEVQCSPVGPPGAAWGTDTAPPPCPWESSGLYQRWDSVCTVFSRGLSQAGTCLALGVPSIGTDTLSLLMIS